ncbi:hypothetical protein F7725_025969 [Dissostichus mawsoni]|uniref:PiggyBac transposable element-derived protein domain-containing protein n=1 Tax=Dissostichus mawsoni TaxID=36200 RepID=A0A7J5X5R1_DISMA|nr:hypothetical protein F7725_025969 [Dissostichus mawsoni]
MSKTLGKVNVLIIEREIICMQLPTWITFSEEKSLKKKGRGSFDIRVEANHNICAVKWYDSRAVTLVPMKSRRWYVYIFWHTILLAVINAWLLYKRECRALKMAKQEILNRREFQADLASSLILVNTTPLKTPKRGRPSSGNGSPAATVTSRSPLNAQKRPSSGDGSPPNGAPSKRSQPPLDVRKDLVAHFPVKTKRGRCRHCSKGYTNTQCTKCDQLPIKKTQQAFTGLWWNICDFGFQAVCCPSLCGTEQQTALEKGRL